MDNPKFIYSSSADRGLDTLLQLWPYIRQEFPKATLDIFYGYENWEKSILQSGDENQKKWMESIKEGMKQPGVTYHGRISQDELAQHWLNSTVWLYPSKFTETYCWAPGTMIESQNKYVAIEKVQVGDKVKTHTGAHEMVSECLSREYSGDVLEFSVTTSMRSVRCTPEHPMYAVRREDVECIRAKGKACRTARPIYLCTANKGNYRTDCEFLHLNRLQPSWIPAGELIEKDYLVYPIDRTIEDREILDITSTIGRSSDEYRLVDNKLCAHNPAKNRTYAAKTIPAVIINSDFLRLAGYYVAEGSSHAARSALTFSFNSNELFYIEEVRELMQSCFEIEPNRVDVIDNTTSLVYNSVLLCELFVELFGSGAREKKLPDWMMVLPLEKQEQLLLGILRGDGCFVERTNSVRIELASELLIRQIWQMLLRFDVIAGLYENYKKVPKYPLGTGYHSERRPYYSVSLQRTDHKFSEDFPWTREKVVKRSPHSCIVDDMLFMPIRKITRKSYQGKVYNLEVENDHSYVVENVATHNCITALEAQLSETVCICTNLAALSSTVGDRGILIDGDAYTQEYREKALQETFAILYDDERRNALTTRAKQWAETQTWRNRAKEWLYIFGITPNPA